MQLAGVLSEFTEEVVLCVTSHKTGIQRRSKWPPTISEVLQACQDHETYLWKLQEAQKAKPLLRGPSRLGMPGSLANVFVPDNHPKYQRLLDWTTTANPIFYRAGRSSDNRNGMWVALNHWQDGLPIARSQAAE